MENDLTLQLKVLSTGVEKITQAKEAVDGLEGATKKAGGGFDKFSKSLESTGSRINVLGQRMTWMVTAPLLIFGNKAVETALEVEKSWVRFRKVFSGTEEDFNRLKKASEELSVRFGRPIEEINHILAEFNKAGVESTDELEKLADVVSQTAIVFDMELEPALQGVKSVMMGYNLTAEDTRKALAAINIIADKTTASEQGILEVFNRAAGTARQAGFSFQELAASQAAFEKNAIPAGRAGNAMKSILVSLTKQSNLAKDQFKALGVDMSTTSWRTANAGDKLKILAEKLLEVKKSGDKVKLADLNEALASLVGKFQINNLNVLLEDMAMNFDDNAETVSQFYRGIEVSADETENLRFQLEQINRVLASTPQQVASLNEKYRLQMAILGNELLPYKIKFLEIITNLITKFNELSPSTQEWIFKIGVILAIAGPFLSFLGLAVSGIGFLLQATAGIIKVFTFFGTGIVSITTKIGSLLSAVGVSGTAGLAGALGVTLLLALTAVTVYITAKAIQSFQALQAEVQALKKINEETRERIDRTNEAIQRLPEGEYKAKVQGMVEKNKELQETAEKLTERYDGLKGVFFSVVDMIKQDFIPWLGKLKEKLEGALEKAKELGKKDGGKWYASGGVVPYASGGVVYAAQGFFPRGKDTVPAMLTPGEMVLNQSQQARLFDMLTGKFSAGTAGGPTVNINVGTMVASRGEQREFARKIKELLTENDNRY